MAKIAELKKYIGYEFSSGSYTGEDYKSFQTKYINYLKAICRENHWQLVNVGRNHYCFSAFIKSAENKCVYISISDVRYFTNEWFSHILIRTAKDEQDYRGGFNHYGLHYFGVFPVERGQEPFQQFLLLVLEIGLSEPVLFVYMNTASVAFGGVDRILQRQRQNVVADRPVRNAELERKIGYRIKPTEAQNFKYGIPAFTRRHIRFSPPFAFLGVSLKSK